jgi:hypothetical protein
MDKIVLFETYYNSIEASIVKERLIANGIPCFLSDENTITVNPLYNQALGGVKLRLFARDVEAAKSILQDEEVSIPLEEELKDTPLPTPNDTGSLSCPVCGSSEVGYVKAAKNRFSPLTMLISLLLFVYPFRSKNANHCFDCGHEF